MRPVLSVVVLSFDTKSLTENTLMSVFDSSGFGRGELEVIVVDNASSDGSAEMVKKKFPKAILFRNKKNLGFSGGNNVGLKRAKGKYVLLLNSDTKVDPKTLKYMVVRLEQDERIGAATCRLELENGKLDPASHRGFPTPWNAFCYLSGLEKLFTKSRYFSGYHQGFKDLSRAHEVDVISGAFLIIPRRVIDIVGLLDERFFLYGEDVDWCYRIRQAGYKIMFFPTVKTVHYKKQSGRNQTINLKIKKKSRYHFYNTMEQFYDKHYLKKYPKVLTWLVKIGIRLKK